MPITSKNWRDSSRIVDDMSAEDIRAFLNEAVRRDCLEMEDEWVERFVAYLEREIGRRIASGAQKGRVALTVGKDLRRLAVARDHGIETRMSPLDLFEDAERLGLGLRDVIVPLCALRDALARQFHGDELLSVLQMGIYALGSMFGADADAMELAQLLRANSRRAMEIAVAVAVEHQSGHNHPRMSHALLSEALSPRVADFRAALPDALGGILALATRGVRYGEILSLAKFFRCAHCVYEMGVTIVTGNIATNIVRELAQNTHWLYAKAVPLAAVRAIMEWRRQHNPPFGFRETVELFREITDVIVFPTGLETLLRYTSNPLVLRAAGDALRAHQLTLTWLVAGYRDCERKIPFEKYVRAVQKFGERAKTLVRIGGDNPAVFLEACAQIGVNRACAIARRVRPAQAEIYRALNTLQRAHPLTPLRALHVYLERGFDTDKIALCARTHERYGVAHQWLADITPGAHTAETLALTYQFQRAMGRKPAAWETDLLANEEFLEEARCRGLKRALRGNGEWYERILARRGRNRSPGNHRAPESTEPAPANAPHIVNRPRPEDPRALRLWVAWRIVKRMWAGRQFGAANVSPEDQRARNLPRDLIGMFGEAYAALVKDGVILTRGGIYTRSSLNPERLAVIHGILAYRISPNTALARWIERA